MNCVLKISAHVCTVYVHVYTCMQPDLSQRHPGVQGSLFGGAALQGGGHLRQSLLHTTGCYRCSMNRAWRERMKPLHKPSPTGTKLLQHRR